MKKKLFYLIGGSVIIIVLLLVYFRFIKDNSSFVNKNVAKYNFENKDYYVIKGDYNGKYNIKYLSYGPDDRDYGDINTTKVMSYNDYVSYCNKNNIPVVYSDSSKNYIVVGYVRFGIVNIDVRVANVEFDNSKAKLYLWENSYGVVGDSAGYVLAIPVDKNITNLEIVSLLTYEEFKNIKKYGTKYDPSHESVDKPIIYLYPTKETDITVKLGNQELITHSYPKYDNEWNVIANSNGDLVDLKTNRKLYALYYENKSNVNFNTSDGFIVEGKDTIKFLEEKLEILGLNEKESEEFIIYWLPKLESNKYNYIRFATMNEINENMPLEINPKPEILIRVLMIFKKLNDKIEIKEQELNKVVRNGYTVIEWGGTELN